MNKPSPKYTCEINDYKTFNGSGRFHSYNLQAEGNTLAELLDSCWVSEIDQDSEEVADYQECGTTETRAITDWLVEQLEKQAKNECL